MSEGHEEYQFPAFTLSKIADRFWKAETDSESATGSTIPGAIAGLAHQVCMRIMPDVLAEERNRR
jgi:hypothetical protein